LSFPAFTQRLRACGPAVIVASSHLCLWLTELVQFLLAATMQVNPWFAQAELFAVSTDQAQEIVKNNEDVRKLLKKTAENGLNSPCCLIA
jgi:hypothetical protein